MLCFGDNLRVMQEEWFRTSVPCGSVQLALFDPPFNSKRRYTETIRDPAGVAAVGVMRAFADTWSYDVPHVDDLTGSPDPAKRLSSAGLAAALRGIEAAYKDRDPSVVGYAAMLAERLDVLYRLIADEGWLVMHGDPSIVNVQQVLLDGLVGRDNWANTVAWCYTGPGNYRSYFPRKHDTLLVYAKDLTRAKFYPDRVRVPYKKSLSAARARTGIFEGRDYEDLDDRLADAEEKGKLIEDWWADITPVGRIRGENLGYPTQKPKALNRRLILAMTDRGDVVFDPFEGGGATLVAAAELERTWVGIDINIYAAEKSAERLRNLLEDDGVLTDEAAARYVVHGKPTDLATARALWVEDHFNFETWAVLELGAIPVKDVPGPDRGIDGRLRFHHLERPDEVHEAIVSVRGGKPEPTCVDQLMGVVDRENAFGGILITLEDPAPFAREAAGHGTVTVLGQEYPRCQLVWLERFFELRDQGVYRELLDGVRLPIERRTSARPSSEKRTAR